MKFHHSRKSGHLFSVMTPESMKPTFEQLANTHRVAFILGATSIDEIIMWADFEIAHTTTPSNTLIDVSLGRQLPRANVIALLNELAIQTNDCWSTRRGMSRMAKNLRSNMTDAQAAIQSCYEYLRNENLLHDDKFSIFVTLEDDVSLIRDGIFGDDRLPALRDELLELFDKMAQETRIAQ